MAQPTILPPKAEVPPAKWQVTSYCFWCDTVKNLVTVLVYGDWRARCIYYERNASHKNEAKRKKMLKECPGPTCQHVTNYRDKLIQEELTTK